MFRKVFILLCLIITIVLGNVAFAEHSPDDRYEAMCQSTGVFTDAKYPMGDFRKNGEGISMQLFGHCGEQPNILIIDYLSRLSSYNPPRYKHKIEIWKSPKKEHSYWKCVYNRYYEIDNNSNIINSYTEKWSKENFINVQCPDIMHITVERYCCAKPGSPIFPDARGNILSEKGDSEPNFLEQGYKDYLNDIKRK